MISFTAEGVLTMWRPICSTGTSKGAIRKTSPSSANEENFSTAGPKRRVDRRVLQYPCVLVEEKDGVESGGESGVYCESNEMVLPPGRIVLNPVHYSSKR